MIPIISWWESLGIPRGPYHSLLGIPRKLPEFARFGVDLSFRAGAI